MDEEGAKISKSRTCTESAEVYAAGISGKVGVLTRGGLTVCRPTWRHGASRGVAEPSEVSRGHSRPARHAAEGPNTEQRVGAKETYSDDAKRTTPDSYGFEDASNRAAGTPCSSTSGIGEVARAVPSNVTAGRGNARPERAAGCLSKVVEPAEHASRLLSRPVQRQRLERRGS